MRNNLVIKFHCSDCGGLLNLKYEIEGIKTKPISDCFQQKNPPDPIGNDCVHNPLISIDPCRPCIEKYTWPAKMLLESLKKLQENEL